MATPVQRLVRKLRSELLRGVWLFRRGPLLSIVVPFYDVEKYFDACLRSLRRQYYRSIEIVVVDDGSPDGCLAIAQRHARRDRRIRIVRQANAGLSAARNTGVREARGEFLTFVDSDDTVLLGGYAQGMASLRRTGSDFAILPYERTAGRKKPVTPGWIADLYSVGRERVTIATHPEMLVHATAWSKIYRRDFWGRAGLEFEPGILYEDQAVTALAHVEATAVDVVTTKNYQWWIRPRSITSEFSAATMNAFFNAIESSLAILDRVPGAREARLIQVLGNDVPHYIRAIPRVQDASFLDSLFDRLPALLDQVDLLSLIPTSPVHVRVAYELIRRQSPERLHELINHEGFNLNAFDGSFLREGPALHLPGWDDADLPRAAFVLSERQTPLDAKVIRARWVSDTQLDLTVWGYLRHVDDPNFEPTARAWIVADGRRIELAVDSSPERPSSRGGGFHESYDRSVWLLHLDAAAIEGQLSGKTGDLAIELEVSYGGRTRTVIVSDVDRESSAGSVLARDIGGRAWRISPTGDFRIRRSTAIPGARRSGVLIDAVDVTEDGVIVAGRWKAKPATSATLSSSRVSVDGIVSTEGDSFTAAFPLEADLWGRGHLPLPIGDYQLAFAADRRKLSARATEPLLMRLPDDFELTRLQGRLIRTTRDGVAIRLVKPRPEIAQTDYGHRRLRRAYRDLEVAVDDSVALFQCYWAEVATDSPLAIHEEMRRRFPGMSLYWGVLDHSVSLPEGAVPVIAGSPEWYDVLARARYIVKNTELGAYTRLRPGQIHVQTFHGQPFKTMGASLWRDVRHLPEFRVRYEAGERRSDYWTAILTATEESNPYYRDNYFYTGPILDRGLPRNDSLVGPDTAAIRERTRKILGVETGQIAILHAATWRDNRSTGNQGARDVDFVDLARLARALGPDHVILQRSHGTVARTEHRHGDRAGVIDVTDYPEINELMLASDAAILDYSSLRFDYGVTGKPMIFLVPDLADYTADVRGVLFDYESSAPGPLVRDLAGLTAALGDLDAVRSAHGAAYAEFSERFNRWHDGRAAVRVVDAMTSDRRWTEPTE